MKTAIVGAGPAGLYLARLLKRARPDDSITVYEQNPEGATWGFGVGLGGRTMNEIVDLDPEVHERMIASMIFMSSQVIHLNGEEFRLEYTDTMGAIERLKLLEILTSACREAGVSVLYNHLVEDTRAFADCDLIVAADGVNSTLRRGQEDAFGTRVEVLTNHFAWFGVNAPMDPMSLVFRSVGTGAFCGHYYPFNTAMSTFVAECDHHTWLALGFDRMDDAKRKMAVEEIFAAELVGEPLVENRSIWRQFPVITNENWFSGNVVLLGDSLRSAHFSIGSGTRLAMEDAAALFKAIQEHDGDIPGALHRFVQERSPSRAMFSDAARRSFSWYEAMRTHMEQPLLEFVYDFMTRTGRITEERMRKYVPNFLQAYHESRVINAG